MPTWRVIDTGLRRAAENIALDRALLEARGEGASPNTLRFLRFTPCALLGFHQSARQELDLDYCAAHGIDVQRRVTGGGALYFDATQIGWELYLDRAVFGTGDMGAIARRVCEMAAAGIRRLGVDARFRPRNDIEVDGRKISGTGGAFDGDAVLYQGTLLVSFDVERMLKVLRIPAEKLSDKAIASARERVANLADLLGGAPPLDAVKAALTGAFAEGFGVRFETGDLTQTEQSKYRAALADIDARAWVYQHDRARAETEIVEGVHKAPGGLLRVALFLDVARGRIKQAWITGDFFVNPKRMVADLEAALRDTPISEYRRVVGAFFDGYRTEMLLLSREDFVGGIGAALRAAAPAVLDEAGGAA